MVSWKSLENFLCNCANGQANGTGKCTNVFLFPLCLGCMYRFVPLFMVVTTSVIDCLERGVCKMTYYVSSGTLNPTHSLGRGRTSLSEHRALAGFVGHGECGAQTYNGGMWAELPWGSRGQSPVGGQGVKPPRSWIPFIFCMSKGSRKFAPLLKNEKYSLMLLLMVYHVLPHKLVTSLVRPALYTLKCGAPRKFGALGKGPSQPCLRPALGTGDHNCKHDDNLHNTNTNLHNTNTTETILCCSKTVHVQTTESGGRT